MVAQRSDALSVDYEGLPVSERACEERPVCEERSPRIPRSSGESAVAEPESGLERVVALFSPGRRGVAAVAAVALVILLTVGWIAWRGRPHVEAVPVEAPTAPIAAEATSNNEQPNEEALRTGAPTASASIVVAVAGRVHRPGLVELPAGARVADAIEGAGGVLPDTDIGYLNLARRLTDGELVLVGVTPPPEALAQGALPMPAGGGGTAPVGGPVNLNTATLEQLDTLPGVGPVLAARILDYRERHGGFRSVEQLREVSGIGDARYEQLRELVTV